ncbi:MAG: hypothetical protein JJE07_02590 [Flavobacteriaceae bacterium]|nr:hypothetical protein [Flavobacteriaceae bacterium]
MDDFNFIKQKLAAFIRKFYKNELLKGTILFFSFWLLYLIIILLIEYFFWLSPINRSILFWIFIAVSLGLLFKFILIPLSRILKLSKGVDQVEASKIIGRHFPEVNDKLLNVLQLQNSPDQSELLLASIAQKSKELKPIPFKLAVNFKTSLRYLKYASFPVIIILAVLLTGNSSIFSESYTRVVHYKTAYEPPAPFSFMLKNDVFKVEEGSDLVLEVETKGNIVPETIEIHYNNETYYLKSTASNRFQYNFQGIKNDVNFYLSGNGVTSRTYQIEVIQVPKLVDFEMRLNYPKYLNKKAESIKGTGNLTVPEGTNVSWNLSTSTTNQVTFTSRDTVEEFNREGTIFSFDKKLFSDTRYQIKTSNLQVKDYESLEYAISVKKDQFPKIIVQHKKDSLDGESLYFFGKVSDDHGFSGLNLVYFIENQEETEVRISVQVTKQEFDEFLYAFPGNVPLKAGSDYSLYFEVFDNDGIRGPKCGKSEVFSFRKKSEKEIKEEQLQQQGESIQNLSQSLDKMQLSERELEEISRLQKEKGQLNYNDRKKLENFLERQKQQTEMIKNYSEKLNQSLEDKENQNGSDDFKEELKERLERNEQMLEENEALLKELQEYADKISREELSEKLEKLSKQNSSKQKNIEQLLELTKRYYVQEKTQKLAKDLSELAEKQEQLSESDSLNSKENQEKLSDEFKEFQKQMDALENENAGLKKPYDLEREKTDKMEIGDEQEKSEEKLGENQKAQAKKHQKNAAQKMMEMSKKMQSAQMMAQGEQLNANIESMRQILSNLMVFSFEQEELMLNFRKIRINNPAYPRNLKKQQVLKEHFHHIDDSLFALALNNPMITEKITSKLTDIEFDINKSLDRLAQNELPQGAASQQYVMTGTNELANMLSDVLGNMEQMANLSLSPGVEGQGQGQGKQLPDIIQSQEQLNQQMKDGLGEGKGEIPKIDKENSGDGEQGEKLKEEMSGELFDIFKQQQLLKQQLQDKLREVGMDIKNANLLKEMEQVERDILNKGFNAETLKRMNNIVHRLLQLEDALLEQEEEERRTSRTNLENYQNNTKDQIIKAKEYFNTTEILNRQTLPLREIYKTKVKQYFEGVEN